MARWVILWLAWTTPAWGADLQFWVTPLISHTVGSEVRYTPALGSYADGVIIVSRLPSGHPRYAWGLMALCSTTQTPDASILSLPLKPLNQAIGLTAPQLTSLKALLAARGMDGSALTSGSILQSVVEIVMTKLGETNPAFLTYRGGACP